jgi:membrane protein DedA with SNARE-associated domain
MFLSLENILISYASKIHLWLFAPLVSFIEEVIPPIPSPSVMIATGSMAQVQNYTLLGLSILVLLGAFGKTMGASVTYFIVDKIEDLFAGKLTKYIGISHKQIEAFGQKLGQKNRDYLILIFLRALPIFPTSVISIGSGLLKVNFKLFVISTFIGSIFRNFIYIYLGFWATTAFVNIFIKSTSGIESILQIAIVSLILIFLAYLYWRRGKNK